MSWSRQPLSTTTLGPAFWVKTKTVGTCVEWTGFRNNKGYGQLSRGGKRHLVHRFAYEVGLGVHIGHAVLQHSCDNPACVKLQHLSPGTRLTNNREMFAKGRQAPPPTKKLTDQDVVEIRRRLVGETQTAIAKSYGVDPSLICRIASGKARVR